MDKTNTTERRDQSNYNKALRRAVDAMKSLQEAVDWSKDREHANALADRYITQYAAQCRIRAEMEGRA